MAVLSTIDSTWAVRAGGGGRTERRYREILIDGISFSSLVQCDVISPFGWGSQAEEVAAIDRLLRRSPPDLPEDRVSFYVCPECGDLGCGAISLVIEGGTGTVIWRDFAFQNNYDGLIHREEFETLGPFTFEGRAYHEFFERMRRAVAAAPHE